MQLKRGKNHVKEQKKLQIKTEKKQQTGEENKTKVEMDCLNGEKEKTKKQNIPVSTSRPSGQGTWLE